MTNVAFHNDALDVRAPAGSFTCFVGSRRVATGVLSIAAVAAARAVREGASEPVLVFDDHSAQVVEIDTRGDDEAVISRLPREDRTSSAAASGDVTRVGAVDAVDAVAPAPAPRGRGRPRLGVVAREVTLLPRHWDWLATQSGGASVALRKLVDEARRTYAERDNRRWRHERAYRFISVVAAAYAGFEEASRALFADDAAGFASRTADWPNDVREYATRLAFESDGA